MKTRAKNRLSAVLATVCMAMFITVAHAGQEGWLTDFEKAKEAAREKNVPILADFAGSDWCGWCIKLDNEVFSQDVFKAYATTNLVLFLADYPRRKQLPAQTFRQNEKMAEHYGIEGFPTVLLLDASGKELARTGYRQGGSNAYVDHLKQLIAGLKKGTPAPAAAPTTTTPRAYVAASDEESPTSSAGKLRVSHRLSVDHASAGRTFQVVAVLDIAAGWHVQAAQPSFDYLVPTRLTLEAPAGVRVGEVRYPPPKTMTFVGSPLAVFDGQALLRFAVTLPPDFAPGRQTLRGKLTVQACDDKVCLAPSTLAVEIPFEVIGADTSAAQPSPSGFSPAAAGPPSVLALSGAPGASAASPVNPVERLFGERGILLALAALFVIGLALNLTPCVYPMLSVTVSIFGAQTDTRLARVFFKALAYVLGIATMYSALGVMAALTGGLFGGLLQSPWVLAVIALLLAALAASMFGLYEIRPPAALMNRLGGTTTVGLAGIYVSGLVVGVFASPCIGPPIIALLALVGAKGDPWFGFGAFFVLSLGLGAPYLILGTFSGLLKRLPKSGAWMVWMKNVFGVVLLGVAAFYFALGFAPSLLGWIPAATLVLGGAYLGFFERSANDRALFRRIKWAAGALAVAAGVALLAAGPKTTLDWQSYRPGAPAKAQAARRPVVLDFYADWCIPCHELDDRTFSDPDVIRALANHVKLKVNLTRMDSPESKSVAEKFGIQGVPTVIVLDKDGRERPGTRVLGFLPPREFMKKAGVGQSFNGMAD